MLVVAATVVTTAVLAISAHGYPARHLSLNDGGVWVSSDKDGLVGRLNKPAGSLDLALNPPGGAQQAYQLDVRQDGAAVVSWDQASGKLYPVDVDSGKTIDNQGIPVSSGEQVELSGGTLAVLDPSANRVWAERVDATTGVTSLAGVDPSAKPIASFGAAAVSSGAAQGAALAVGTDGTVYAATVHGKFATIRQDGDGFAKPVYSQLDASLQSIQLTAVGTRPVILDAKAGSVVLPGGQNTTITANAESALQQPSPSGDAVIVATPTQLLSVPLDGAKPSSLYDGGGGKPASPTWLGACVYAAWPGTPGVYVHSCGGGVATPGKLESEQELVDPVFRVNRDTILLNDLSTGAVYDLDTLQQVDDWSAAKPPPIEKKTDTKKNKNDNSTAARDLPPKATDVTLGARPGRTTVLHLLDYDSDPQGYVLAIDAVSLVGSSGATLSISPDAQTVEITMPSQGGDVHFSYTIDDGKGAHASADVTVQRRLPDQNQAPALRRGFQQHTFSVAAGGSLDQPVLGDWRDFDGDPVVLAGVDPSAGTVTRTPDGQLDYVAPATGGPQTITYEVSDGIAPPVSHKIPITVLAPDSNKSVAPTAEPDTARGQTGKPITIEPLANDLPGVDPNNPHATLSLAGDLASPAGATIVTDLKTGVVTLTASRKNTYLLSYTAAYGDAPYSRGTIRVDVTDPPASPLPPIAMPDTAAIYGQAPATVDVLANDFDPAGGVLVVQHAAPVSANQLQVAIVDGRWLRINALTPSITPGTETVDYTITDGRTNPVTGQVTVTQLPPPADDTPVAVDDYATVRAGDSVSIPVLSNDVDPDGAELSLLDDVSSAPRSGQLSVTSATGSTVGVGAAFVSGSQVRYVPPAVVTATESVTIAYVAKNPTGEQTTGTAHVTINPAPTPKNPDHAPVPQAVTARIVAGDSVTISVPTTGIDPDGDTATITGLASAPTLGRVLATSPTSVSYEAFPTSAGTDTFSYLVTDRYGLTGQATISVGVVPPGQPQPPVAVNESLTAAPHSTLRVDVLSNAVIAADDTVTITPLSRTNPDLAAGIRLASASGPIVLTTPAASSKPMVVLYSLTDGIGSPSPATLTVHVQAGYVAAPIALDATAVPKAKATTVTVNLLGKDSDPTGSALHISRVFDGRAVVSGSSVTLPLLDHLQNVPYEITAANGATAAAV
ncbi:Ig-like domain-containing protein, partial [Jatrophihabitans sp.]|uniref:Ig-like domain-containing protein n=1 Tax=Jatrophihabitans sp. TaxID=1932789 RepID=UPI0030C722C7|nr:hypothetical protein [Jatrophihabitans sp.]